MAAPHAMQTGIEPETLLRFSTRIMCGVIVNQGVYFSKDLPHKKIA